MMDDEVSLFCDNVRSLLCEIQQIKKDTGYSSDQVLLAMLVEAVRSVGIVPFDGDDMM